MSEGKSNHKFKKNQNVMYLLKANIHLSDESRKQEIKGNNYSTYVRHSKLNVMEEYQRSIDNHAIFDMDYECLKSDGTTQKVNGFAKHKYDMQGKYIGSLGRLLPI